MPGLLDPTNRSALDFNHSVAKEIFSICAPLFENFDITFFTYSHFLEDGTYLDVSTDPKWHEYYLWNFGASNFVRDHIRGVFKKEIKYFLWEDTPDKIKDPMNRQYVLEGFNYKIYHRFTLYKSQKRSVEAWQFATDKKDTQIINFYVNNFDLLKRFIMFFNEKASKIINPSDLGKLLVLKNRELITDSSFSEKEKKRAFFHQTKIQKFEIKTNQGIVYLSRREAECGYHLTTGKTIKEVGKALNLSPRTVEAYVNNIKQKLRCWSKSQISEIIAESFINNCIL